MRSPEVVHAENSVVHRVEGWRLPSGLVPWIGRPYDKVPTPELLVYWEWFVRPGDTDHLEERADIELALDRRDDL